METNIYKEIQNLQKRKNWFLHGRNHLALSLIKKHANVIEPVKVLDVGCSEGGFLATLKSNGFDFSGIDVNQSALDLCKNYGCQDNVKYGDALSIPFENETFDVVTLLDIIEHIEDDSKALKESMRVCKAGGMILIFVPAHQWLWSTNDVVYHHKRRYSQKQIVNLLKSMNLKIKNTSYFNMFLFVPFLGMILLKKIMGDTKASNVLTMVPRAINWIFTQLMKFEAFMISKLGWHLPFGSSIVVSVEKI